MSQILKFGGLRNRTNFQTLLGIGIKKFIKSPLTMKRSANSALEGGGGSKMKQAKLVQKEKKSFNVSWKFHGDPEKGIKPLMYLSGPDLHNTGKIAAFDMDGCLIVPNSGKRFPTGPTDWKFVSAAVPKKLKSLHAEGFKVVLFTNQAGIEKKKTKASDIQTKINDISSELGFPLQAFASTGENIYRKPYTGAWDFFVSKCNGGEEVDKNASFFVGDAAGRPKGWVPGKKKDHSCSDRKFAVNVGLKFYTPEEYFDGGKSYSRFEWGSVNPKSLLQSSSSSNEHGLDDLAAKDLEMIISVGYPASGKSTFAARYLKSNGYVTVNRDTLKTQEKCMTAASKALMSKKSVVVDNTNPSKETRKAYIDIAKKAGANVRCFHFDAPKELAQHLNYYRQAQTSGRVRRIPDVGYNIYKSKYQMPEKSEGFSEVRKIPFVPKFDNDTEKELFLKWT